MRWHRIGGERGGCCSGFFLHFFVCKRSGFNSKIDLVVE